MRKSFAGKVVVDGLSEDLRTPACPRSVSGSRKVWVPTSSCSRVAMNWWTATRSPAVTVMDQSVCLLLPMRQRVPNGRHEVIGGPITLLDPTVPYPCCSSSRCHDLDGEDVRAPDPLRAGRWEPPRPVGRPNG